MRWRITGWLLVVGALAVAAAFASAAVASSPPGARNVVLVLTDDQPARTLASMPIVQAELVSRGVTFTNAVVSNPLCCPSRATILTGRYAHTTGVWTNNGRFGGWKRFRAWERGTVAARLQRAGYTTGLVGKYMNLYGKDDPLHVPPGWDRWFAFVNSTPYFGYTLNIDGELVLRGDSEEDYSTDVLAREAARFVRSVPEPFLLVVAPNAPHAPFIPARRHAAAPVVFEPTPAYNEANMEDKPRWTRGLPPIDASRQAVLQTRALLSVDELVGSLLDGLEEAGRMRRTAIVYTSDNGLAWGEHRWLWKGAPWEESIRVPLVVRADGLAVPGTNDRLVANVDLAATIYELSGLEPDTTEGRSLVPLLRNDPPISWRSAVTLEFLETRRKPVGWPVRIPSYCGLRLPESVYVQYATGEEELYDLRADPWQLENLARDSAQRATIRDLRKRARARCSPLPPWPPGWTLLGPRDP